MKTLATEFKYAHCAVAEGREEGHKRGREEERAKAQAEKIQSAKKMLKAGLAVKDIAEFTGLPVQQIEKLT